MNNLLGFAPDLPTTTPGIIIDCTQFIPYDSGMRAAPSLNTQADALAAACRGAATLTKLDGTRRVFAGTAADMYELSGSTWGDVSRAANYTLGADTRWSFTQFGDTSVASSIDNVIQTSVAGAFADQATAPQARIVESVLSSGGGFVFAFNTIDATYGTSQDRWWCCALNNVTSWTPSVASQATTGRLLGVEGPITAAKKLGADRIVAYKAQALYTGVYVGPPTVWAWTELPTFGVAGPDAVADIGTAHFCVSEDDLYIFDGARPIPVATNKVRQWFIDNSSGTYRYRTTVQHDRQHDLVWVFFVSEGSSTGDRDRCLVYHLKTQQWGKADRTVEAALIFNQPTVTFDSDAGTFDSATDPFDAVSPGNRLVAVFDSSHVLSTLDGTPGATSFTLHDIGDDNVVSKICVNAKREAEPIRLQYMTTPSSASIDGFYTMATGLTQTTGVTQSASDVPANGSNAFFIRQTARWHRLKFNFTGLCRVAGYNVPLAEAGKR
jgi:hypothetical protein